MYTITSSIAFPYNRPSKLPPYTRIRQTMAKLKVGDSFFIPKRDCGKAKSLRSVVPYKEAKRVYGYKLMTKTYSNGVRVWRAA